MKSGILNPTLKQISTYLGLFIFVFLGIGALMFYQERVIYIDSSYYAFNLINEGYPAAEHNRYALYLYQVLPWFLLKLNASIPLILKAFSLSHVGIHLIAFFILLKIRQYPLALLLSFLQIICYRECYYLSVNETSLAISTCLLLSGLMRYFSESGFSLTKQSFCYFICILIAVFSHPIAMLLIPFVLVYHYIYYKKPMQAIFFICMVEFINVMVLKFSLGKSSSYETELYIQIKNSFDILQNIENIYSFHYFYGGLSLKSNFVQLYLTPILLSIFGCIYYFKKKKLAFALYNAVASLGMFFIIIVLFNRGDGNMFMEKNFAPLIFILIFPLTELQFKAPKMLLGLLFLVFYAFNSFIEIYQSADPYTKRYQIVEEIVKGESLRNHHKIIIQDSLINHDIWLGTWALPYETLLISKILNQPNTTVRIYKNEDQINKELYRTDLFLGADFIPPLPATYLLNQKYFKLPNQLYWKLGTVDSK